MRPTSAVQFACFCVFATPALAMDWYGVSDAGYFTFKSGTTHAREMTPDTFVTPMEFKTDTGWIGSFALGTQVNSVFRGEIEGIYSQSSVNEARLGSFKIAGADGSLRTLAGMANVYADLIPNSRLRPFVGAGVGLANIKLSKYQASGVTLINDDDNALAWQAMAGLRYQFTPLMSGTLEYRYMSAGEVDLESTSGERSSVRYRSHNALAGLEFKF